MKWIESSKNTPKDTELVFVFYGNHFDTNGGAQLNIWKHACGRVDIGLDGNLCSRVAKKSEMPTHWMYPPLHPDEGEFGWNDIKDFPLCLLESSEVYVFAYNDGSIWDSTIDIDRDCFGRIDAITHWMMLPKAPDELGWKKSKLCVVEDE